VNEPWRLRSVTNTRHGGRGGCGVGLTRRAYRPCLVAAPTICEARPAADPGERRRPQRGQKRMSDRLRVSRRRRAADGASALLIVKNEFTDSSRQVRPLPLPFLGSSLRSAVGRDACAGRPDGVRRSAQVMGGDVSHRNRLTRRQCSELRWIGHPAGRGIRPESRSVCVTHAHLTADPCSTDIDGLAGPAVTWLMILEQMQHVLGAQEGPVSQQSVVFVRQSPPATDGDQSRITLLQRHAPGASRPPARPRTRSPSPSTGRPTGRSWTPSTGPLRLVASRWRRSPWLGCCPSRWSPARSSAPPGPSTSRTR
jgi:hypothetical protein